MKAIQTWAVVVGSCLAVACTGGMGQETGSDSFTAADWSRFRTIRLHEQDFRSLAAVRPRPAYPEQSIEQGVSGVAVAEVLTTPGGRMQEVRVLEAPDRWIGEATSGELRPQTGHRAQLGRADRGEVLWGQNRIAQPPPIPRAAEVVS